MHRGCDGIELFESEGDAIESSRKGNISICFSEQLTKLVVVLTLPFDETMSLTPKERVAIQFEVSVRRKECEDVVI
jgi:hypothetical protein